MGPGFLINLTKTKNIKNCTKINKSTDIKGNSNYNTQQND